MPGDDLLAVCTVPPWPATNGYALRVSNLLEELLASWRITLLSPTGPVAAGIAEHRALELDGPGVTYPWRFDQTRLRHAALDLARTRRFDRALVWPGAEALWFGSSGLPPAVMDMIDCNPLEFAREALAPGASPRARLSRLRELAIAAVFARRTVRSFASTVCVGEQDAAWMRRIGGRDTVHVVPNGVAAPNRVPPTDARPTAIFTGTLDYAPNVDAALYLASSVWPLIRRAAPDAILILAGRHPVSAVAELHGRDGVQVAADVPDMADVLGRAWVAMAPMRIGVGIKNKVLEAWACARPVVMTELATNGLTLPPGHEGLVGRGADGLARAVVELLQDEAKRRRLGEAASAHARLQYSWRAAAARMDVLLCNTPPS